MAYVKRDVGCNYYACSRTWSCVSDFRSYFGKTTNYGSNTIATVKIFNINNWYTVKKDLAVGDVIQYDSNGYAHSIIVSLKYGNNVYYCAHTSNKRNEDLEVFYDYMTDRNIKYFYVISYK